MPHALIHGTPPDASGFAKRVLAYGGGHVVLHEIARSLGGDRGDRRLLVRATVDEPDLTQQLLVVVQHRRDDEWIVRLESFGDPIVTPAVRGAVHAVTDWLERHADVRVAARNY
jgi:tRNA (guanine-N7-)-methyltransferase